MSVTSKPVTLLLQSDDNIFTIALNWNDKTYLTSDGISGSNINTLASWSADGSRIVYTNVKSTDPPASGGLLLPTGHIWSMNADGSDETQLTFGSTSGALPSFSPDQKSILFTGYDTGNPELWLMNVDGTDDHPITHTIGSGVSKDGVEIKWSSHGSFSPDGTKIAYSSTESGHAEIWVMNSDSSDQKQLTFPDNSNAPDANNPTWSPDGGTIVYFGGFARDGGYIFTMNPDGSDRTQLTYMHSDDPSWSPDGQQIFFDVAVSNNLGAEAWIMNRDGSDQRFLSSTPVSASRVPAITKLESATIPDDLSTAQKTNFNFQDMTPPGLATTFPDILAIGLDYSSPSESGGGALAMDLELNKMSNDNGDVGGNDGGCGGGCW